MNRPYPHAQRDARAFPSFARAPLRVGSRPETAAVRMRPPLIGVTMVRGETAGMRLGPPTSKYSPLAIFLRAQPPAVTSLTLTLAEVKVILGAPLPVSAYRRRRDWWTNAVATGPAWAWLAVGWRVTAPQVRPGGMRQ